VSLRGKTLLIVAATLMGLCAVLYLIARVAVLRRFAALEDHEMRQNLDRVSNALSSELDLLNTVARDDSQWDDAYHFVQHPRPQWGENNFSSDTLQALRLNLILYLNNAAHPVHARQFDPQLGRQIPVSRATIEAIIPLTGRLASGAGPGLSGLILLPDGPMLVAVWKVLPSTGEGPPAGTLIIGRKLDKPELKRLAWTTSLRVEVIPVDSREMPSDFAAAHTHLSAASPILIAPLGEKAVAAYTALNDLNGRPAMILRVQTPRTVYQQGQTTVMYLVSAALFVGGAFTFLSLFLLERLVLSRLISLSRSVSAIAVRSGLSERIKVDGNDEVSQLAASINQMLASIERSERERQVPEAYLEGLFESAPEAVVILDNQHRVVRVNHEFTRLFGYTLEEARGRDLDRLIVPPAKVEEGNTINTSLDRGDTVSLETQRRTKDGRVLDVSILGTPVQVGSGRLAFYGIFRDITDRKRTERLHSALYRIAEKASSSEDLQDLFTTIHQILGDLIYAKNCYVALHDAATDVVSFPYFVDEKDVVTPAPHPFRKGLTEYVLRTGKPLLATPDIVDGLVRRGEVETRVGAPSRDWMGVPLKQGETTFGVLTVQTYESNIRYGESEKEILTFVSQQVASAVLHQRNQDALRQSESRFRALAEHASTAIYIYGKAFHYVNPATERLFGYTRAELMAMEDPWSTLVHPEFRDLTFQRSEARLRGESVPSHYEFKIITKSGDTRWVDFTSSAQPIQFAGKAANVAIAVDVTDRKAGEQIETALYRIAAIASSADDPQELFAGIHSTVSQLMDARNFYLALYDASSNLLSFPYFVDEKDKAPEPRSLMKGLTEYLLRTGQPLLATPEVFSRLVASGEVETVGSNSLDWLGVPLKIGETTFGVLVVQSYSPSVRYGEREKEILTFVSQNVASAIQHKRSQQALRDSEVRYRTLVQSAVYGIFGWSLDDRFTDVNPALVAMLGYGSAEEVLALRMTEDVYLDPTQHRDIVASLQTAGQLRGVEAQWRRQDGKTITVRLSGRSLREETGRGGAFEMIVEDITERRLLEDQLRQSQKMEAIGQLAGGVAHDFNNLLMVIKGNSQLLLEKLHTADSRRAGVEQIQKAAERAASLTSQLLAFSRKQVVAFRVLDLATLLTNMEQLLRRLLGEQIELRIETNDDLGHVKADPGQVEQIVLNLALNARDAMPEGGKLILQVSNEDLGEHYGTEQASVRPGRYVQLAVTDNGTGIESGILPHIFEPFFTTKPVGKGTGLGLSTVYGIVKQSGGYIWASSELGKGTTFRVYLPRVDQPVESPIVLESRTGSHRGSETVLLVEDEEGVRSLIQMVLGRNGYKVIECRNAEEALRAIEGARASIHLLLTDLILPRMSGRELAERVSAARPDIRILYMSGYTDDSVLRHGVLDSKSAFLQKPFSMELLLQKVRDVLGRAVAAS
jgi:two-component system, cell cycle sensor histidine kinase and response regulator CckA